MKHTKGSKFLIGVTLALTSLQAFGDPPTRKGQVKQYRQLTGENTSNPDSEHTSRVATSYNAFLYRILHLTLGQKFVAMRAMGFSGAGYEDMEGYRKTFASRVKHNYQVAKNRGGAQAKLVVVMGGTVDGFGAGYEILNSLREQGYKDIIVTGMASSEAAQYHLEGHEKGWGDVIAPHQDALLLLDTYKDGSGNQSRELKEKKNSTSRTSDILIDLSKYKGCEHVSMEVFEGDQQAFKEAIEFASQGARVNTSIVGKPELVLHVGFEPSRKAAAKGKDKGYRAARQVAITLADHPQIQSVAIDVKVGSPVEPRDGSPRTIYDLHAYFSAEYGKWILNNEEHQRRFAKMAESGDLDRKIAELRESGNVADANLTKATLDLARASATLGSDTVKTLEEVRTAVDAHLEWLVELDKGPGQRIYDFPESTRNYLAAIDNVREVLRQVNFSLERVRESVREKEVEGRIK